MSSEHEDKSKREDEDRSRREDKEELSLDEVKEMVRDGPRTLEDEINEIVTGSRVTVPHQSADIDPHTQAMLTNHQLAIQELQKAVVRLAKEVEAAKD